MTPFAGPAGATLAPSKDTTMADLRVIWEDDALRLLEGRDRYTRNAIREEFRRDPSKGAVEIDTEQHQFLTPVSDNRFTVVWRLDDQTQQAVVSAVVPLTNVTLEQDALSEPGALERLRPYVVRAVTSELIDL